LYFIAILREEMMVNSDKTLIICSLNIPFSEFYPEII